MKKPFSEDETMMMKWGVFDLEDLQEKQQQLAFKNWGCKYFMRKCLYVFK